MRKGSHAMLASFVAAEQAVAPPPMMEGRYATALVYLYCAILACAQEGGSGFKEDIDPLANAVSPEPINMWLERRGIK